VRTVAGPTPKLRLSFLGSSSNDPTAKLIEIKNLRREPMKVNIRIVILLGKHVLASLGRGAWRDGIRMDGQFWAIVEIMS
jgi:hypothetical protein